MRSKNRIPIILENIDWNIFLTDMYGKDYDKDILSLIIVNLSKWKKYWTEHYDQRIGQALINFGVIPDNFNAWNTEGIDWMIDNKLVEPRDILYWGVNFTKNMDKLHKTEWRLIKDLDTGHIQAVLDGGFVRNNSLYEKHFKNELKLRDGRI